MSAPDLPWLTRPTEWRETSGFVFHVFVSKDCVSAKTEAGPTRTLRFLRVRLSEGQGDGVRRGLAEFRGCVITVQT